MPFSNKSFFYVFNQFHRFFQSLFPANDLEAPALAVTSKTAALVFAAAVAIVVAVVTLHFRLIVLL